jgi:hypothetical protein
MGVADQLRRRGAIAERADLNRMVDPLDHIRDALHRQREVLAALDILALAEAVDAGLASAVLTFLCEDAPTMHLDEACDLHPLLRRRATPDDAIAPLLARIEAEHAAAAAALDAARAALEAIIATGAPPDAAGAQAMRAHARAERRRLILENAIILPLARTRLTARDRRALALRIAARRGVCLLPEPDNA